MFGDYDKIYASKIFNFTPDITDAYDCEVIKGGTGYDIHSQLPTEMERVTPDYSIYPYIDNRTAYGFLTRGCPNKCPWCVVPKKEGAIKPYMDVEEIAVDGRTDLILMDNNVLASDYGLQQMEKIAKLRYRIDFNQAMDARLVTPEIAKLIANIRWLTPIRFGCDTPKQISECERAMALGDSFCKVPRQYLMYTMIGSDINEAYHRLSYFRGSKRVRIVAQPYRDPNNPKYVPPQWQKDMAQWSMRRVYWASCDFKDFYVRKGFQCKEHFKE